MDPYDDDPELVELYHQDQLELNAGPHNISCPSCGRKNMLTEEMRKRGYHCVKCIDSLESGNDGD
jgi:DNA-directed RNA polymerase subunit RPC12/RpoP